MSESSAAIPQGFSWCSTAATALLGWGGGGWDGRGCPRHPGGMQAVDVGCCKGGLWGCSVLRSARQQEFRKPTRGECQVRLYRSQTPACLLVLLEPVSDLISLGGSCLINTHLAARRPHRPYIVSLPAPSPAVPCRNAAGGLAWGQAGNGAEGRMGLGWALVGGVWEAAI